MLRIRILLAVRTFVAWRKPMSWNVFSSINPIFKIVKCWMDSLKKNLNEDSEKNVWNQQNSSPQHSWKLNKQKTVLRSRSLFCRLRLKFVNLPVSTVQYSVQITCPKPLKDIYVTRRVYWFSFFSSINPNLKIMYLITRVKHIVTRVEKDQLNTFWIMIWGNISPEPTASQSATQLKALL